MNSEIYRDQFFKSAGIEAKGDWEMCSTMPHLTLIGDFSANFGYKLAPLLDSGMPVLIYNGDQDYICNIHGAFKWTNSLVWTGQTVLQRANSKIWTTESGGGEVRNANNFTVLTINDAGHMVPMDQPSVALSMINEFIETKMIKPDLF